MAAQDKSWCDKGQHKLYENYADFNDWLENGAGQAILAFYGLKNLAHPSKALYVGDNKAYFQAFDDYQKNRRHAVLNKAYFTNLFADPHWFERNLEHFEQLINCMADGNVVPFIGAGVSVAGGFPTWQEHLRQQGKTAHIDPQFVEDALAQGNYEAVIAHIERRRGRDVFIQEIT
jgi:hypothetical protein